MPDLTRKTINVTARAIDSIVQIRAVDGYNETDTINRALILNATLLSYMENGVLTILDSNGEAVKLVMI